MGDNNNGGIGFVGLLMVGLTILFVGLKLTGNIDWDWKWVLAPIWIPCVIGIVIAIIAIIFIMKFK